MNEYSICVSNGKVVGDSTFFSVANNLLDNESKRLCEFTDALDKDSKQKKEYIAEYKCAKYRYASVSVIQMALHHNNRSRKSFNLEYSHYLLLPYDQIFIQTKYSGLYEEASANEKPDYSLYYAMLAFADSELEQLEAKIGLATDWEKVELEERIGGLKFAQECLNEAWQKRKEVIA